MFGAFGCTAGDLDTTSSAPADPSEQASPDQTFKRTTAEHLADVLTDATTREQLVGTLRQRGPVALIELTALVGDLDAGVPGDAVPEIWLREPQGVSDSSDLLVAYAPAGNKHTWTEIPAYMLGGTRVALDPHHAPDVPVLVIETYGQLAMHQGIEQANLLLQSAGLLRVPSKIGPLDVTGIQTTRLDSIRLADDHEPWISGAAEIYAIVSGVIGSNDPQMQLVDLPYLDNDGTTYTPNQIVVNWSNYAYQVANIQLFEHDSNTNYQDLITAIIAAVGAAGSLAGYPTIQAITEIANRIIAAIPASVFTNDDDYVDSFYTIQEFVTYTDLRGAGQNATVSLTPFFVVAN
ncbi:MAG TPA: DUF3103 family protein [Kofleriaceae bacterium]|jgi:hypothetical protein|nr:DUF3103 family protein [Kofleriaceae bacterium]